MDEYILETEHLYKKYKKHEVIKDVSVKIKKGKIYGLIGENGAGKSTFMRLVTGLSFPNEGNIKLFGNNSKKLATERKRIGCMIEYPSFIPYMTAKENLTYHRTIKGIPDGEIEEKLLDLVGLKDAKNKKAKNFSLGMKQRLGIAIALLGNPELLILDEPVNGLDPKGIIEVRELLKKLSKEKGMTIIISSHNLPELYQLATDFIILHKGQVKENITSEELDDKCRHAINIKCDNVEKLASVLETKLKTTNYKVMPNKVVKLYDYLDEKELVSRTIFENGINISEFIATGDTLEDYFISAIGGDKND